MKKFDIQWLIENKFVRKVDDETFPNLAHFNFITTIDMAKDVTIFFYGAEIDGDLLLAVREAYYVAAQDEHIYMNRIHVCKGMTIARFEKLVTTSPVPTAHALTLLSEEEQAVLLQLDLNRQ